jgi:ion channel-forming bestrophin family protein
MAITQDPSKIPWLQYALRLRGSVIPTVLPRTLLCGVFGAIISLLHSLGMPVNIPVLASVIPNVVLGLMLVFRTNTAYERFWEGRKLWGNVINAARNLARHIWVLIPAKDFETRQSKIEALHLLVAFAIAMKLHLRQEPIAQELEAYVPAWQNDKLKMMNNPPLEIAFWIQDYLQYQHQSDRLNIHQLTDMQLLLNTMVDALGGCERILKTPIPMAYAIHLKQLLLIYCLTLPFQMVSQLQWWTAAVVILISFTLFGIEAIGIEIENPFGQDHNDLPLDTICDTMKRNIDDLTKLEPISR